MARAPLSSILKSANYLLLGKLFYLLPLLPALSIQGSLGVGSISYATLYTAPCRAYSQVGATAIQINMVSEVLWGGRCCTYRKYVQGDYLFSFISGLFFFNCYDYNEQALPNIAASEVPEVLAGGRRLTQRNQTKCLGCLKNTSLPQ